VWAGAGVGDPAMHRWAVAGLANARVQREIRHQPVGAVEAGEVDGGDDRDRDGDIDAGHGHQSGNDRVVDRRDRDVPLDVGELIAVEVELTDQRVDAAPLVAGQVLNLRLTFAR
jgi:hypothetical protein